MKTKKEKVVKKSRGISAGVVILFCLIIAFLFFTFVCGRPENFVDNNPKGHPLDGNIFGTLYKGGYVIPLVMTLLFTVITLSVERFFALRKARGKKDLVKFVAGVKAKLEVNDLDAARQL